MLKYDLFLENLILESMDPNDIDKFKRPKPRVYHRTKDDKVELIGRDGYRAGIGAAWGPGIYTVYDLTSTTKVNTYNDGTTKKSTYGPVIMENEVLSLRNFLIFNYDISKRVYKENYTLEDQLRNILPEKAFKRHEFVIKAASKQCLELIKANPKNKYTARVFDSILDIKEIMHHLRGVVFTGENDGNVLISYDRENLVPVRYSKDDGKTWTKITKQGAYVKAKKNLKMLMSKGDTRSLAALVEDHIKNEISKSYGFGSVEEYVKSEKMGSINVDAIMPFSYIFDLDDAEYPSIPTVKAKIRALYKPGIDSLVDKMKDEVKNFDTASSLILSTAQFDNVRNIVAKAYPEKVAELNGISIAGLKTIKEFLSNENKNYNITKILYIKKMIDYVTKGNGNEKIIEEIKEMLPNVIKDAGSTLALVSSLAKSVDGFNKTFKELFETNVTEMPPMKGADLTKLVEMSRDIESKLDSVIEKNQNFVESYGTIKIPNYKIDENGELYNTNYSESVEVNSNIIFLSDSVVKKFVKVGYKLVPPYSGSSSALSQFFNKFISIYGGADSSVREYLDRKFEENIELLRDCKDIEDFKYWFDNNSFPDIIKIRIALNDKLKGKIEEKKLKSLVIQSLLHDDGNTNHRHVETDSVLFKKTLALVKSSGIKLSTDEALSDIWTLKNYPQRCGMLSREGIIDRSIFLMLGLYDLYGKEPKGLLSDEEKKEAEERLQDGVFAKKFFTFLESAVDTYNNEFNEILNKLPIKLSRIIEEEIVSKYKLGGFISFKITGMIKSKSFEELDAFIDFLIEKKATKKGGLSIDAQKVSDIPAETIMKIIENDVFVFDIYGEDGYKSDEMALALAKKGIIRDDIAESPSVKENLILICLGRENIEYDDLNDIKVEKIDVKANADKILRLYRLMKEDPKDILLGIYLFCSPIISNPNGFDGKISKELMSKMMASLDVHLSKMKSIDDLDMYSDKEIGDYQKKNPGYTKKNIVDFLSRIKPGLKSENSIKIIDEFVSKHSPQMAVAESRIFRFEGFLKSRGK